MSFAVSADAYRRFMGRFSEPLAEQLVDALDPPPGTRAIDVGSGPGAVTAVLVRRLGPEHVVAVDPSEQFVDSLRHRFPDVQVHHGTAERLAFTDSQFDLAVAQLVVHFMRDPVAGLAEMRRVTRPGGTVAASVWDMTEGGGPLEPFWHAARTLDPRVDGERSLPGARRGHLAQLFAAAGLEVVHDGVLSVRVTFASFEEWWEPFTARVGPAGEHVRSLSPPERDELRARAAERLGPAPFDIDASAWFVVGRA